MIPMRISISLLCLRSLGDNHSFPKYQSLLHGQADQVAHGTDLVMANYRVVLWQPVFAQ